ncbi:hypothetical protein G7Z17_g2058 [Cylindrodendrum hubeiense]|uniref:Uncharacterized protein n=1 Tax=Cylindrodendrum hubeiense TaxID=595255 RepID=A0A9P5LLF7_9HYPO|nr:hypothetical protein G7Z17_g2058 [Cylindrodendrum hubeiense]
MKFSSIIPAGLATLAAASPTRVLEKRSTTWCDSYGSLETGGYTVYHNNWGSAQATSGSQCTTFDSVTSGSASWSTSWTWAGGSSSVKSYSNIALVDVNTQLSAISSIPSKWTWSYTGSDIVADVAYDLWLAPSATADNEYEIMVWLAAYGGAGPISSTGSSVDTATIAGSSWEVYSGTNGDTTVFSFVATSTITSFDGDLNEFFTYLTTNQGVSTSMYATSLQAGTEPFTGTDAVFDTTAYSMSVNKLLKRSSPSDLSNLDRLKLSNPCDLGGLKFGNRGNLSCRKLSSPGDLGRRKLSSPGNLSSLKLGRPGDLSYPSNLRHIGNPNKHYNPSSCCNLGNSGSSLLGTCSKLDPHQEEVPFLS